MSGWRDEASCIGMNPNLFYPEQAGTIPPIVKICKDCPVRKDCLEEGIHRNEWGWWGGVSAAERSVIRRRRGMAAIAHVRF